MIVSQRHGGDMGVRCVRTFVAGSVAIAALASSVPAVAQLGTGQSGSSSTFYVGSDEALRALADFGVCYASQRTPKAIELVSTRAGSVAEAKTYKRLFANGDNCLALVDTMTVDFVMVRGSIAEGLYRKSIPVPPSLAVANAPSSAQVTSFAEAALCFAASHSTEVEQLLNTRLGRKAKNQAVYRLLPGLASCVPEKARNISISPSMIRFRLAEALWRLGYKPAVTAGGQS
jgi:hypothetical protein